MQQIKQLPKKSLAAERPLRPGFGIMGREIMLWSNYFNFVSTIDAPLYRYDIQVLVDDGSQRQAKDLEEAQKTDPKGKSKAKDQAKQRLPTGKRLKRIIELLLEEHLQIYQNDVATDFKANLICRQEIEIWSEGYPITYRAEGEDDPVPNAKQYRVLIQATGSIRTSDLVNHLTSSNAAAMLESKEAIIQALNIVVGHNPKATRSIGNVGANRHFDLHSGPEERRNLGAGLEAIRGLFVSVRAATARLLVNVQVKSLAVYSQGPLEGCINAFLEGNGPNRIALAKFLTRVSVDVTHIRRTNKAGQRIPRIKTIQGLANQNDGRGLTNPPIVPRFGAGAKEVKFFKGDPEGESKKPKAPKGGGKKGKKVPAAGPDLPSSDGYISVYDFFRQGESKIPATAHARYEQA